MKPPRLVFSLALLYTLAAATAIAGSAGGNSGDGSNQGDDRNLITSVDISTGTVVENLYGASRSFHIGAETRINVGIHQGTIDQIKPGMQIFSQSVSPPDKLSLITVDKADSPGHADKRCLVTSVNASAGTVEFEDMHDRTIKTLKHIVGSTPITVDGHQGSLDEIKPGMQIDYSYPLHQLRIAAGKATPPPEARRQ